MWCPCCCDVVPVSSGCSVGVIRRRCVSVGVGVGVGVVGTWCQHLWEVDMSTKRSIQMMHRMHWRKRGPIVAIHMSLYGKAYSNASDVEKM